MSGLGGHRSSAPPLTWPACRLPPPSPPPPPSQVLRKFGVIIAVNISVSLIYSLALFVPMLMVMGPMPMPERLQRAFRSAHAHAAGSISPPFPPTLPAHPFVSPARLCNLPLLNFCRVFHAASSSPRPPRQFPTAGRTVTPSLQHLSPPPFVICFACHCTSKPRPLCPSHFLSPSMALRLTLCRLLAISPQMDAASSERPVGDVPPADQRSGTAPSGGSALHPVHVHYCAQQPRRSAAPRPRPRSGNHHRRGCLGMQERLRGVLLRTLTDLVPDRRTSRAACGISATSVPHQIRRHMAAGKGELSQPLRGSSRFPCRSWQPVWQAVIRRQRGPRCHSGRCHLCEPSPSDIIPRSRHKNNAQAAHNFALRRDAPSGQEPATMRSSGSPPGLRIPGGPEGRLNSS